MVEYLSLLVAAGLTFARHVTGIIVRPYETYRKIVDRGSFGELLYIGLLLVLYFALASVVKTAAFRPFLLTKQFVHLSLGAGFSFFVIVATLWLVGTLMGGKGSPKGLLVAWAYTLVPTVLWFFSTSVLYVFLPPPRTTSFAGIAFSVLFLGFSTTLLFWKVMLAYLTLRFSLHMDLLRIIGMTIVVGPFLAVYSYVMYRLGIFRVPFL